MWVFPRRPYYACAELYQIRQSYYIKKHFVKTHLVIEKLLLYMVATGITNITKLYAIRKKIMLIIKLGFIHSNNQSKTY